MSKMNEDFLLRLCKIAISHDYLSGLIDALEMNRRLTAVIRYENGSITLFEMNQYFD